MIPEARCVYTITGNDSEVSHSGQEGIFRNDNSNSLLCFL